jgi:hypothetical protein
VAKGIVGTFKGYALVSLIFGAATSIAEWQDDAKKDGYDLVANLLMGVLKAVVSGSIAILVVSVLSALVMALFEVGVPVIVIGLVVIGIGTVAGYVIELIDKKLGQLVTGEKDNVDGLSSVVAPYLRQFGKAVQGAWIDLMKIFPRDYKELGF